MLRLFQKFSTREKPKRLSPKERERLAFEHQAREQLLKLARRGLSLPIVSL